MDAIWQSFLCFEAVIGIDKVGVSSCVCRLVVLLWCWLESHMNVLKCCEIWFPYIFNLCCIDCAFPLYFLWRSMLVGSLVHWLFSGRVPFSGGGCKEQPYRYCCLNAYLLYGLIIGMRVGSIFIFWVFRASIIIIESETVVSAYDWKRMVWLAQCSISSSDLHVDSMMTVISLSTPVLILLLCILCFFILSSGPSSCSCS